MDASRRDRSLPVRRGYRIDAKQTATITQNVTNWRAFGLAKLSVGVWILWISVEGVRGV